MSFAATLTDAQLDAFFASIPVVPTITVVEFASREDAVAFMCEEVDDSFIDDICVVDLDAGETVEDAEDRAHCMGCGKYSRDALIAGRRVVLFCTYGH